MPDNEKGDNQQQQQRSSTTRQQEQLGQTSRRQASSRSPPLRLPGEHQGRWRRQNLRRSWRREGCRDSKSIEHLSLPRNARRRTRKTRSSIVHGRPARSGSGSNGAARGRLSGSLVVARSRPYRGHKRGLASARNAGARGSAQSIRRAQRSETRMGLSGILLDLATQGFGLPSAKHLSPHTL